MMTAPQSMHTVVLGAGSWGTALAALASRQSNTLLWARRSDVAQAINRDHRNTRYLPDITLPDGLRATADLDQALQHLHPDGGLIILGVPMAGLDDICRELALRRPLAAQCSKISVIWTCKGLHPETTQLAHEIAAKHLNRHADLGLGLGVLSGPSFAHEVARGLPVALTIATRDSRSADRTTLA